METPEYASMMARLIRRYGVRVGDADPIDLGRMVELRHAFDDAIVAAVRGQREAGFTWAEVGEGLGTSREAAYMRFGSRSVPKVDESSGFVQARGA